MSFERVVRLALLPEMRLAYFEAEIPIDYIPDDSPEMGMLWESFNAWRLKARPALGRIDIAALAWQMEREPGATTFTCRVAVPIRSDYQPPAPAKTTFFAGGAFAFCYADNIDEIAEAFAAVDHYVGEQGLIPASSGIEAYKFHYNLDQHPCDCGVLVTHADGSNPLGEASAGPLPIAR